MAKALHETRVPGINGTEFYIRSLDDGTLEIHGQGNYPALWVAPSSSANVVAIVPVDLFASRDRRPIVRDPALTDLALRALQALEEARARRSENGSAPYYRKAHDLVKRLRDVLSDGGEQAKEQG